MKKQKKDRIASAHCVCDVQNNQSGEPWKEWMVESLELSAESYALAKGVSA